MDEATRLKLISYGLYRIVNDIVGSERLIHIRRTVTNLSNDYEALYSTLADSPACSHLSGSVAEGFRFSSSDRDLMFVFRHIKVIDYRERNNNHGDTMAVLRMETEQCRPGFALLRLVSSYHEPHVIISCVQLPNGVYVSSTLWKKAMPKVIPNGVTHGPCDSGMLGDIEVDHAACLKCESWPESALSCITRLQRVGWPSAAVISKMLTEGCHLVAIGGKGSYYEDIEWRMSFSFAEKTLIHNMNHCQFLCYGLLKVFLKEAITGDENGEKLLCSYFLKTSVFWEICNEQTTWNEHDLLACFWVCLKRLIAWVYNGYCPNFFIPENNMFYGKIQGQAQQRLLCQLMTLYNEGHHCLLRCQSLQPLLSLTTYQPFISLLLPPLENNFFSKSFYDLYMIKELTDQLSGTRVNDTRKIQWSLQALSMMTDQGGEFRYLSKRAWKKYITQYLVLRSSFEQVHILENRETHDQIQLALKELQSQAMDVVNHHLLSAVYLYRCGFYSNTLNVLLHAKSKLQQPNVMCWWRLSVDKYRAAGGEHTPLDTMMKKVVAIDLRLHMAICVPELTMEHQASLCHTVCFPPLAMINFLTYLSHYHLEQYAEAAVVFEELSVLVNYDDEQHIHREYRAISWTMLGICQEMSGELTNAYQSYYKALNDRYIDLTEATRVRIENVLMKIRVV